MSKTKKRLMWNKQQRSLAISTQSEVSRLRDAVTAQVTSIERHDTSFVAIAHAASKQFLEQADHILSLSFTVKSTRGQFITVNKFKWLLEQLNAALKVWNITMCSPEARSSMDYAALRKHHKELHLLTAWKEEQEDNSEDLVPITEVA